MPPGTPPARARRRPWSRGPSPGRDQVGLRSSRVPFYAVGGAAVAIERARTASSNRARGGERLHRSPAPGRPPGRHHASALAVSPVMNTKRWAGRRALAHRACRTRRRRPRASACRRRSGRRPGAPTRSRPARPPLATSTAQPQLLQQRGDQVQRRSARPPPPGPRARCRGARAQEPVAWRRSVSGGAASPGQLDGEDGLAPAALHGEPAAVLLEVPYDTLSPQAGATSRPSSS